MRVVEKVEQAPGPEEGVQTEPVGRCARLAKSLASSAPLGWVGDHEADLSADESSLREIRRPGSANHLAVSL